MGGLIIAAPASGNGKTTITLGLIRSAARGGMRIRSAKSGPDYIDPRFHEAASGAPCVNLDAWAMTSDRILSLAAHARDETLIIEGAMGLFDGAPPCGKGSTADLARILNLPVILVVDAGKMAGSIAPLVHGFASHDGKVSVAGVILNNVGSPRHETMLRRALEPLGIPVFGAIPRDANLAHPSRHLGLMQAGERADLDGFLNYAADVMQANLDIKTLLNLASATQPEPIKPQLLPPPAQTIAVAQDHAFGFSYPHMLADWRRQGAEIRAFSPLADETVPTADFVFLPGGYPELHAGQIATNTNFITSLRAAAESAEIYGECGGYMVLGEILIDADGTAHPMAGLLGLETSFAERNLHLGYRNLAATSGPFQGLHKGHEFHYATTLKAKGTPLFKATDAEGTALSDMGLRQGRVCGSFAHVIDRVDMSTASD